MIDRNHPAVEAALNRYLDATRSETGSKITRGAEPLDALSIVLTAALPHLTADDLRDTPAGSALMAEAWDDGYDAGEADGWLSCDDPAQIDRPTPNPYKETPPNE